MIRYTKALPYPLMSVNFYPMPTQKNPTLGWVYLSCKYMEFITRIDIRMFFCACVHTKLLWLSITISYIHSGMCVCARTSSHLNCACGYFIILVQSVTKLYTEKNR